MLGLIQEHFDALRVLCERYHVDKLEAFGSATTGDFDPQTSDLDFLVAFGDVPHGERFDNYFGFLHALEDLFGRRVDLVESDAMQNPFFIRRVNETRRPVYASRPAEISA